MSLRVVVAALATVAVLVVGSSAQAGPIQVIGPFHFVDALSGNSLGVPSGVAVSFGAFTNPGPSTGTTGTASQMGVDENGNPKLYQYPLNALVFTVGEQFFNSYPYNLATAFQLLGSWHLEFTNPNSLYTPSSADTPTIIGAAILPFANSVTISGSGNAPRFDWTIPSGYGIDQSQILIWDLETHDLIATQLNTGTSYQVPPSLNLQQNHRYSIQITLVDLRNPAVAAFPANILSQSRSFFDFTLLPAGSPPQVTLPTPCAGTATIEYCFNTTVTAGQTIFIDPLTAIGYEYRTGAGDPNSESVLLPAGVGDDQYELWLWNGTTWVKNSQTLFGGVPFHFPSGGVDRFRVVGIEAAANVDPSSPTAFVTGLTFVSDGSFTGRMSPIVRADIDVKPGSDTNPIKLGSNGNTPVAVLSTATFDATTVDLAMVTFASASAVKSSLADVNGDGIIDQVFQFVTKQLLLTPADSVATLFGRTSAGQQIAGTDTVRVTP